MNLFHQEFYNDSTPKLRYDEQAEPYKGAIAFAHYHHFIEILYCIEGEYDVEVNGRVYKFHPGDLVFIDSNIVHSVTSLMSNKNNKYIVIKVHPSFVLEINKSLLNVEVLNPVLLNTFYQKALYKKSELEAFDIAKILQNLKYEFEHINQFCRTSAITVYINTLIIYLIRICYNQGLLQHFEDMQGIPSKDQIYSIIKYINKNYSSDINPHELAKKHYMSYSYFAKIFKQCTSFTFTQYLNKIRIEKSEDLLLHSNLSITEVALNTGFPTTSYFIKTFKREKHITPKQFRMISQK